MCFELPFNKLIIFLFHQNCKQRIELWKSLTYSSHFLLISLYDLLSMSMWNYLSWSFSLYVNQSRPFLLGFSLWENYFDIFMFYSSLPAPLQIPPRPSSLDARIDWTESHFIFSICGIHESYLPSILIRVDLQVCVAFSGLP